MQISRLIFRPAGTMALALTLLGCSGSDPVQPGPDASFAAGGNRPPFVFPAGCCYYEGRIVRTVVPPASMPKEGQEDFFGFPGGAAQGQKAVVATAPGDQDYQGGKWRFHAVTWNVAPYLLTSAAAVASAAAAGDVTVTQIAANDFKCPIQP